MMNTVPDQKKTETATMETMRTTTMNTVMVEKETEVLAEVSPRVDMADTNNTKVL